MRHFYLALFCLLLNTLSAEAQTSKKVVSSGYFPLLELSYKDARQQALNDAFSKAIAEAVGINVQSENYLSKSEVLDVNKQDSKILEAFSQVNRSVSYGHVVNYKVLEEKVEQRELGDGQKIQAILIKVECEVVRDTEKPDPSFKLSLSLNKNIFYSGDTRGEGTVVMVESSMDAYVTIFCVSGDAVYVLFPNEQVTENKLAANKTSEFPSKEWRERGVSIRAELPEGVSHCVEMIFAIATKDPVQFKTEQKIGDYGVVPTYKGALVELNRWLSQIPPSRRAEASDQYEIRRK